MSQTKQASVEEIWNSNSKTFDSGYHNTHIDYMDKETFIKLLREYSQSKDREIEELKERCISWAGKYDESQSEKEVANHELLKLQAEFKYWRERCLASEEIYRLLNLGQHHAREYLVWEKLQKQKPETK